MIGAGSMNVKAF